MTALTKGMKEGIAQRAVKQAFGDRNAALEVSKQKFAEAVYADQRDLTLQAGKMAALPQAKVWLCFGRQIYVAGADWGARLKAQASKDLPLLACERYNAHIELRLKQGSAALVEFYALLKQQGDLNDEGSELTKKLEAMLLPIKTFAQFRTLWPEGVSLLPVEPGKSYAVVDANLLLDVNKLVGLPPGGKV